MFKQYLDSDTYLALLQIQHAPEMFNLIDANRTHLRRYLPWVDYTRGVRDSKKFIETALMSFAANRELHAGIWHREELVGVIGAQFNWNNHNAIIGYWLGAEFQGKGIMTKACHTLVDYCISSLNLHRIEIRCDLNNKRSRAIPQRLGFTQEGISRDAEWLNDRYADLVIYGLLAPQWISSHTCPKK